MDKLSPQYGKLVKFKEAIAFFKQKVALPSDSYRDLRGSIHAHAFTVAGANKMELLTDLYNAVNHAIENGETITAFRKRFDQIVTAHGWSYNGKRGWRTSLIYHNNKNTARAAGRWQQMQLTKERRPYLMYLTAGDNRVRDEHRQWDEKILRADHPFWQSHYPPNGHRCRCTVVSLSQREMERRGLSVTPESEASAILNRKKIYTTDAKTGELLEKTKGIDIGWEHNVGTQWLGADISVGKAIAQLQSEIQVKAVQQFNSVLQQSASSFTKKLTNMAAATPITSSATIGHLNGEILSAMAKKGQTLATSLLVIEADTVKSMLKSGISLAQLQSLQGIISNSADFSNRNEIIKIAGSGLIVTIRAGSQLNKVIAVERL